MEKGRHDLRMRGHLRHGTGTGGTGGDEIEVGVASQLLLWIQVAPVGASLSRGLGTWQLKIDFFTLKLHIKLLRNKCDFK